MLSHPWYAAVVVSHVLFAVIGFGTLAMTGSYAALVKRSVDPYGSDQIARYFRPGRNIVSFSIYLVPVFGGIALWFSGDTHRAYPYVGAVIWFLAVGVASGMLWPAEARIQRLISMGPEADVRECGMLLAEATRCERAAAITSLLFVAALAVMIAQP